MEELAAHPPPGARLVARPSQNVFSVVQRKVVNPNDFFDLAAIETRLAAFEERYNNAAEPFDWTFDRHDLDKLLERIAAHEHPDPLARSA